MMLNCRTSAVFGLVFWLPAMLASAQTSYRVIAVQNPGSISGTVKWSGPQPHAASMLINKDQQVCDPESAKTRDLERLVIGSDDGVANAVVYLKNVPSGKAFDFPENRAYLDQKHCRYEPHILLVPAQGGLRIKSSDPVLHTVHMTGVATYNLPFPFTNQTVSRPMQTPGVASIRCNGGHTWMNAEVFVASHPYFAVTDTTGHFELTGVPPGDYEIVAWHEGWNVLKQESSFDVLTERRIQRPVFSEAKTWEKRVTVGAGGPTQVNFVMSEK
jgi:hypothetical protein